VEPSAVANLFLCHDGRERAWVNALSGEFASLGVRVEVIEYDGTPAGLNSAAAAGSKVASRGLVALGAYHVASNEFGELECSLAKHSVDSHPMIPLWHNVTAQVVAARSPLLARLPSILASSRITELAKDLVRALVPHQQRSPASYHLRFIKEDVSLPVITRTESALENCYFESCRIIGPIVLVMFNDGSEVQHCRFTARDVFFSLPANRRYVGFVPVRASAFIDCDFERVGIAGEAGVIQAFLGNLAGAQ
jgi:hypothetical protein